MKDILKPCPFCGSAAIMTAYKTPAGERYRVVCPSCMASVDTGFAQSGHHAAKAWNRRTEKESENLLKYERALAIAMHDTRTAIQQANDNQLPAERKRAKNITFPATAAENTATTTWRNRTAGGNKSEIQARGPSMDRTAKRAGVKP